MHYTRETLVDLHRSLTREWLLVDGRGGCAASTIAACPTSRFHGLLVAPRPGDPKRHVYLSRFEEALVLDGRALSISIALYEGGNAHPTGHQFLESFDTLPHPTFRYRLGEVVVTREIRLVPGHHAALVRYSMEGSSRPVQLRLRPYLPCRAAESLTYANDVIDGAVRELPQGIWVRPYDALPAVSITVSAERGGFEASPAWSRGFEYPDDLRTGYPGHEDQFAPGEIYLTLLPDGEAVVAATIEAPIADPLKVWRHITASAAATGAKDDGTVRAALERAADQFTFADPDGRPGMIAGWPWFAEWGRDAFISLPGLTLARGRVEACGAFLSSARSFLRDGRLPNVYGIEPEASHYRAIDPSLWFARAVGLYDQAGGDRERLMDDLLPALREIGAAYRAASDEVITCDEAGLLRTGTPDFAFTWMDSVPYPGGARHGVLVEINALWYELVDQLSRLERRAGNHAAHREWAAFRRAAGSAFLERFWLPEEGYLADGWDDGRPDRAVRPNMVIAAALEASPLNRAMRSAVVDVARRELLTPRGLRTLSPRDPGYRGTYAGPVEERDAAYHQGTVWPWLLGFYCEARLRGHGRAARAKQDLRKLLEGFAGHLGERCLDQVSEVFDGDPPHRPGGAVAQAWSVAELLRAYVLVEGPRR